MSTVEGRTDWRFIAAIAAVAVGLVVVAIMAMRFFAPPEQQFLSVVRAYVYSEEVTDTVLLDMGYAVCDVNADDEHADMQDIVRTLMSNSIDGQTGFRPGAGEVVIASATEYLCNND